MLNTPTLRQWRYLVALAENRHFGKAAEACFVTQSTLSAGIQELETQLGAPLVDRTKRKVVLTPLGEELAGRGRELLREAEDMVLLARAAQAPLSGPLRLGVIPTISPFLLPRVLPALRRRFPDLRLFLREDLTLRLIDQLHAGKLESSSRMQPEQRPLLCERERGERMRHRVERRPAEGMRPRLHEEHHGLGRGGATCVGVGIGLGVSIMALGDKPSG